MKKIKLYVLLLFISLLVVGCEYRKADPGKYIIYSAAIMPTGKYTPSPIFMYEYSAMNVETSKLIHFKSKDLYRLHQEITVE